MQFNPDPQSQQGTMIQLRESTNHEHANADIAPDAVENQDDTVSSKWMVEIMEDCFLINAKSMIAKQILPKARVIEENVKASFSIVNLTLQIWKSQMKFLQGLTGK